MPLTFHLSTQTDPKPRTYLSARLGERGVSGAVYPHNWSDALPKPPFFWHWAFIIGPTNWSRYRHGSVETQDQAQAVIGRNYALFLDTFGLREGVGRPGLALSR